MKLKGANWDTVRWGKEGKRGNEGKEGNLWELEWKLTYMNEKPKKRDGDTHFSSSGRGEGILDYTLTPHGSSRSRPGTSRVKVADSLVL